MPLSWITVIPCMVGSIAAPMAELRTTARTLKQIKDGEISKEEGDKILRSGPMRVFIITAITCAPLLIHQVGKSILKKIKLKRADFPDGVNDQLDEYFKDFDKTEDQELWDYWKDQQPIGDEMTGGEAPKMDKASVSIAAMIGLIIVATALSN